MFKDVTDILCLNVASGQYANTLISYSDVPVAAGLQMICCQQHAWKDQPSQWQNAAVRRCDRNSYHWNNTIHYWLYYNQCLKYTTVALCRPVEDHWINGHLISA